MLKTVSKEDCHNLLLTLTDLNDFPGNCFYLQHPPKPFKYSYEAGRAPGGKPDRYVEQEGDGSGQIRGSYTYLDPNWTWQTVSKIDSHQA